MGIARSIDGKSDTQDFKALLSAMQVLGFTSEEQDTIFKILASVLHLGNVYFHRKQMRHGQEGVEVGSDAEIRWAAHLLQVNSDGIIRALTTKTTVRHEKSKIKAPRDGWIIGLIYRKQETKESSRH